MDLSDFITDEGIFPALKANSKKQVLQILAEKAAQLTKIDAQLIKHTIIDREKLGSTGVGNGIAIPHGKLPGLKKIFGIFARLETPIDYDAIDDQPVDLIFLLLAPENAGVDHLKALSRVARLLRDQETASRLRTTEDARVLWSFISNNSAFNAA